MNNLIVEPDKSVPDAGTFTGARALASAQTLASSEPGLETGLNGTVMALDILAMVMNPLKELMMAGVGFLIEHVGPLRDFLDMLAGDPVSINATKDTWKNIEAALAQAAADLVDDANSMSDWSSDTAEAYRRTIGDFGDAINAASSASGSIAKYMEVMGIWTAVTRGLVLELICDFVSRVIMYALSALASAWFTMGGSIAAMISAVIAEAIAVIAKLADKIARLGKAMQGLAPRMGKVGQIFDDVGETVGKFGTKTNAKLMIKHHQFDMKSMKIQDAALDSFKGSGPLGRGSVPQTQLPFQNKIYDTLTDPFGSGNIPGTSVVGKGLNQGVTPPVVWRDLTLIDGKNVADIITGYPMTGIKGGMGGGPGALQDAGPTEEEGEKE
ncbi:hypothetical protein [Glycomyces sp. NRRL B-16210]|uniref:hypothetical protein n=1 Tax=Glycomyces sp. NRRL B-16210 TaxID=1463821 RepID=UPI0004C09FF1|nr:hypothetical protein [Glycomyces sp. NRRL B-16210]